MRTVNMNHQTVRRIGHSRVDFTFSSADYLITACNKNRVLVLATYSADTNEWQVSNNHWAMTVLDTPESGRCKVVNIVNLCLTSSGHNPMNDHQINLMREKLTEYVNRYGQCS